MTDDEFNELLTLEKRFMYPKSVKVPQAQQTNMFKVISKTTKDHFLLDCDRRGKYEFKYKNQLRYNKDILMARLEINAPVNVKRKTSHHSN